MMSFGIIPKLIPRQANSFQLGPVKVPVLVSSPINATDASREKRTRNCSFEVALQEWPMKTKTLPHQCRIAGKQCSMDQR
ncbi:hypothetical protein OS493_023228 [Desmophyllum pertusum]|uniref:Uncharacterized protein n=1 Tax=Desmophyllum pertusum TaxID=174260 RepID=A0A9X0CJS2_9CNID|nr:hypothetical protein OS493_023228 [Desmophyllum pertusum]